MKKILHIITHRDLLYGALVLIYSIHIIQHLFALQWIQATDQFVILVWVTSTWLIHVGYDRKKVIIKEQAALINQYGKLLEETIQDYDETIQMLKKIVNKPSDGKK